MPALHIALALLLAAPPSGERVAPPTEIAHAFGLGARTEFFDLGMSGVLVGYDFGELQLEGSVGAILTDDDTTDLLGGTLSAYYRVHRMANADFALGLGGGFFISFVSEAADREDFLLLIGGRTRIFVAPNVALLGTLGAAALIGDSPYMAGIGARPLGAVGFEYYFQ